MLIYVQLRYVVTLVSLIYEHNHYVLLELQNTVARAICDVEEADFVADASCRTTRWTCVESVLNHWADRVCVSESRLPSQTQSCSCATAFDLGRDVDTQGRCASMGQMPC